MTDETHSILVRIMRYEVKGSKGVSLESVELVRGLGILGDYNEGRGERQVSFLSQKAREFIETHKDEGLCFARFKENLTYSYNLPETVAKGAFLSIGKAVLRVTDRKRCFSDCVLFKRSVPCPLSSHGIFAEVINGGIIRLGDKITVIEE